MADRTDVYPSQQPTDTIWLTQERNKVVAIGWLAQGVFGTATVVDGLGCIPTVPATLAVQVLPGSIYQQSAIDNVGYGTLGTDTVDQIIKQGIILPITSLTLTPPGGVGQAINYLIQTQILEQDILPTVLSYFNSANPSIPFTGPGGSGTAQPTIRQCTLSLVAKAGVAAAAGSQLTPTPDAGYVGLWVVTVANGATQLTATQITQYASAPFIPVKLPQVPGYIQGGTWAGAVDTGTANQIIVTLNPAPASITAWMEIRLKKISTPSNGAMTVVVNGAAPVALVNSDGSALTSSTPMAASFRARIVFDGTSWAWTNPTTSTSVGSLSASSGEGVNVSGGGIVSLNYPSLSVQAAVALVDLFSFYSQGDTHHRVLSWAQFLALIQASLSLPSYTLNEQIFLAGTYTWPVPLGITRIKARGWAGGGSGGGSTGPLGGGTGASPGGYCEGTYAVVGGQILNINVGFGAPAGGVGANGSSGGTTSLSISGGPTLFTATGGNFGSAGLGSPSPTLAIAATATGGTVNNIGSNWGLPYGFPRWPDFAIRMLGGVGGAPYGGSISGPATGGNGHPGSYPGGGGSASGGGNFAGGYGADGQFILEW